MKCQIKKCKRKILYPEYAWVYEKGEFKNTFCSRECLNKKYRNALK